MERTTLQRILTGYGIPWQDGKAVNVCCPFCTGRTVPGPDTMYRCGIWPDTLRYYCWRCNRRGPLYAILHAVAGVGPDEYRRLVGAAAAKDLPTTVAETVRQRLRGRAEEPAPQRELVILPNGPVVSAAVAEAEPVLGAFLRRRRLDAAELADYGCRWPGWAGEASGRLVIPVCDDDGRPVAWQGRDITGLSHSKYFTRGDVSKHLFWTVELRRPVRAYVVEGCLDAMRMAYNAVATFTHAISRDQRRLLLNDPYVEEVVFAWDGDSYDRSLAAARELAPLVRAGAVRLPGKDPDELGGDLVRSLPIRWA